MNEHDHNLITSVAKGDIEAAIEAIQAGAKITTTTTNGSNLLYLAASKEQFDMFDWLLEVEQGGKKIDLEQKNISGNPLLIELAKNPDYLYFLKKVLDHGANPNVIGVDKTSALIHCVQQNNTEGINLLLKAGADINYTIPKTGVCALLSATIQFNPEVLDLLLKYNPDINKEDADGKNALTMVLSKHKGALTKTEQKNYEQTCEILCNQDFDVNRPTHSGATPIWLSCLHNNIQALEVLLKKPGANADVWHDIDRGEGFDFGKTSGLHLLLSGNKATEDLLKQMLACGAKLGVPDNCGNLPESFGFNNPNYFDFLIKNGADINAQLILQNQMATKKIYIPVVNLIMKHGKESLERVRLLLNSGAKIDFSEYGADVQHPIIFAMSSGSFEVLKLLITSKKIDLNKPIQSSENEQFITPLMHLCTGNTNPSLMQYIKEKNKIQAVLRANEEATKSGKPPLLSEGQKKQLNDSLISVISMEEKIKQEQMIAIKLMLNNGADINQISSNGQNALFFAKDKEIVDILLKNKINPYHKDLYGNNPLVHSFIGNKEEVIESLTIFYKSNNKKVDQTPIDTIYYDLAFLDFNSHLKQRSVENSLWYFIKSMVDENEWKNNPEYKVNIPNINKTDDDGNHGLLIACANNLPFLVSFYLKIGADINLSNNLGESPLMHAIATENFYLVEFLVKNNADVLAKTKNGKSVQDFSNEIKNEEISRLINQSINNKIKNKL